MSAPLRSEALGELLGLGEAARSLSLRDQLSKDPARVAALTFDAEGIHLDLSKQLLLPEHLAGLLAFARASNLEEHRDAMLSGAPVNLSEDRAALHVRSRSNGAPGLEKVRDFVRALRRGEVMGATGAPLRAVVNLGIGGSDLGPRMAHAALARFDDGTLEVRFASSLDPTGLDQALAGLDPAEVLFVAATKSFTTQETGVLAHRAVDWLRAHLGPDAQVSAHLVAVTAHPELAQRAGIGSERTFVIDEGIGGRYSVSSAMGLPVMAAIGPDAFDEVLNGFAGMDNHFATERLESNLPVLHGLIGFWNRSILGFGVQAVVPYSWDLRLLPEHLAQLVMESNGKSVDAAGHAVDLPTSPVLFGAPGTEAQHSFFQLLHQGTDPVPVDLIGVVRGPDGPHDALLANLLAQSQALAFGRSASFLEQAGVPPMIAAQRSTGGDRPSSVLLLEELTPTTLGALLSLYEHSVYTQAVLWGINPFDQFGVELGKELAADLRPQLTDDAAPLGDQDASTTALINWIHARR